MQQKEKISVEQLTEEVKALLQEDFVAQIIQNNDRLQMQFLNGQNFVLTVEEIA